MPRKLIDKTSNDSALAEMIPTINQITNNFLFPGPTNHHLTRATPPPLASSTSVQYDVQFSVPPYQTSVHYGQPSDTMPENTSFNIRSKSPESEARAGGLDKNLVGHSGEHGVTGCSPSSISGHQQSESARPPYQSYGQPICLSAEQLAFSSLV